MKYVSTRDPAAKTYTFEAVVMAGLAPNGGLFVPQKVEKLDQSELEQWASLPFPKLAHKVMSQYIDEDQIPAAALKDLTDRSYGDQWHDAKVTPLKTVGGIDILEQFHGPTCAFKDVALQFVGNLFEFFLKRKNSNREAGEARHFITVLGATSGDTGGAAIYGLKGKTDVSVCILHPEGKIAKVQEWQMTSVMDANVHNVAIEGDFDDCQNIVKKLFNDRTTDAEVEKVCLGAVNSINWARILAQIVYYFSGYHQWVSQEGRKYGDKLDFVVPTGNFGNALAGHFARQMGLPIGKIVIATNANDILHRFISGQVYQKAAKCHATLAPAMDITIPSNFERYLYEVAGRDAKLLASWMTSIKNTGTFSLGSAQQEAERRAAMEALFSSSTATDTQIEAAQHDHLSKHQYQHCPHTAIGIHAVMHDTTGCPAGRPYVVMATAHHGKFGDKLSEAKKLAPEMPEQLAALDGSLRRLFKAPNDDQIVKRILVDYVAQPPVEEPASSSSLALAAVALAVLGAGAFAMMRK